eukprot:TRINITY_DN14969_c1_g1_i1.p1 TRINITY_DN14969_c1_g1~~TRINITY_DN14969_c1_g1_i1.p1  ORF type:complete len:371 (+),score=76.87 TRINITY_DN14969_c1_g1_i1:19-1131(+)
MATCILARARYCSGRSSLRFSNRISSLPWPQRGQRTFICTSKYRSSGNAVVIEDASFGTDIDVHRERPVRPLVFESEALLFESHVDIEEIVDHARRKCFVGAGLAVTGFYMILASTFGTLPIELMMLLGTGALANSYALVVLANRLILNLSCRHVHRLSVLPTPAEFVKEAEEQRKQDEEKSATEKLLLSLASIEERLAATPEIRLQVTTARSERWFSLVNPLKAEDGFVEEEEEGRARFVDICKKLRVLDFTEDDGMVHDQSLFSALLNSTKILVDERAVPREDIGTTLSVEPGHGAPGLMLSEVSKDDVEKASKKSGEEGPAEAIHMIGIRAFRGGMSVFAGGVLFLAGESARDSDGIARWYNLKTIF